MKRSLMFAIAVFAAGCGRPDAEEASPVVTVQVARAELGDMTSAASAPATVFPREQANISARITAPVRELRARKGDRVARGQVLAVLENSDVAAQAREARAALADAEANLRKLTAGTLPTDIERARGQVAMYQAALNQAQKIYERRSELFKQGAIPGRELLASQTEVAQARTNYEVARRSLELLEGKSREEDIRGAKSRVDQARARLEVAEAQLQFTEVRSPFAGVITEQFLYPGDMAKPDAPIFTVMDLSVAVARAQAPETDAARIRSGQPCSFESVDSAARAVAGRVTVVNKAIDTARRTVEVWCEIPNAGAGVRAGAFGKVAIVTGSARGVVIVPASAVQFSEGAARGVVFVVDAGGVAHRRDVETGEQSAGKVQISSGLKAGEIVIVEGAYGLPDGTRVRVAGGAK